MPGVKRKQTPVGESAISKGFKKSKLATNGTTKSKAAAIDQETVTDSDPLEESNTTEHSGDDDGISGPSENGEGGVEADLPIREPKPSAWALASRVEENGAPKGAETSKSSREAHAKQKTVVLERKAAKPNADSIARSKKLWERLRRKSHVPREERKALVAELFEIVTGRVKEFVLKHDSVRVIQTALKYANPDQKKMIAKELKGEYRGLAESKYAKFLIGKVLVHGDEETRDIIVPELYGHVRRLIKHPEASWILDDIYRGSATPSQKALLLREWYGAEFAIFKSDGGPSPSADLKSLLAQHPEKRTPILRSLHDLINQLVQKKTTGFTMLHDAMLQYYLNVLPDSEEGKELVELLKGDEEGDLLKNLAFTKSGARLVCLALAHGNAKDRKQILKTYKNTMKTLAFDAHGHHVILVAYDVIDDTVLTSKSIFPELFPKELKAEGQHELIMSYITSTNARIPLLYPFTGKAKAYLPQEDMDILSEIHAIRTTTSKKDPETRRKELTTALSPSLLPFVAANAEKLIQTSFGCQFTCEILLGAEGTKSDALQAIARLASSSDPTVQKSLLSPAASRMLKSLVLGGRFNRETKLVDYADPPLGFNDILYTKIKNDIVEWATGPNAFVVVGLTESPGFTSLGELKVKLKLGKEDLERCVRKDDGTTSAGKVKAGGNRDELQKLEKAGRQGTKILLGKLDT